MIFYIVFLSPATVESLTPEQQVLFEKVLDAFMDQWAADNIDLIILIIDGSTRDMGTTYQLIREVLIPALGEPSDENKEGKILIAINQADMAMLWHWNFTGNKPDETLRAFLDKKLESVRKRIKEGTGIDVQPIYYCAGYKEDDEEQKPYNLVRLWMYIFDMAPKSKRIIPVDIMRRNTEIWQDNDDLDEMISQCINQFSGIGGVFDCIWDVVESINSTFESLFSDLPKDKKEK